MQGLDKRYADISYAPAELTRLAAAISEAAAITKPMPSEETAAVKRLAKIGLKSESFAREALDVARSNPTLLPVALDVERMAENLRNRDELMAFMVQLEQLYQRVRVAVVLHGVDAYADGLAVYHSLQRYGKDDNLREVAQRLGRIFKGKGRRKKTQESDVPVQSAKVSPAQPVSPKAVGPDDSAEEEKISRDYRTRSGDTVVSAGKLAIEEPPASAGSHRGTIAVVPSRSGGISGTFASLPDLCVAHVPWTVLIAQPHQEGGVRLRWSEAPRTTTFATLLPATDRSRS